MRKAALIAVVSSAALMGGCAEMGLSEAGLFGAPPPDEFAVARQAPLTVPPEFELVPPQPGAPANAEDSRRQALEALFGGPAPRSAAETALISSAGGVRSDPGIRSNVGDPDTFTVAKGTVTRDILAAPQGDGREAIADTPTE